jgi:hypothetical protein
MNDPVRIPKGPFYFDPDHDTNDGKPWDDSEIEDLVDALKSGGDNRAGGKVPLPLRHGRRGQAQGARARAIELGHQ